LSKFQKHRSRKYIHSSTTLALRPQRKQLN